MSLDPPFTPSRAEWGLIDRALAMALTAVQLSRVEADPRDRANAVHQLRALREKVARQIAAATTDDDDPARAHGDAQAPSGRIYRREAARTS